MIMEGFFLEEEWQVAGWFPRSPFLFGEIKWTNSIADRLVSTFGLL
jgi:hypothetical protein